MPSRAHQSRGTTVARADGRRRRALGGAVFRWAPVVLVLAIFGAATASYHYDLGTRWLGAPVDTLPSKPPPPGPTFAGPLPTRPVAHPAPAGRPQAAAVR